MRFWLIELPALIVDVLWRLYLSFLTLATLSLWLMVMVVLVLYWGFGIRWGW